MSILKQVEYCLPLALFFVGVTILPGSIQQRAYAASLEELFGLKDIQEVVVSPDGDRIAFVVLIRQHDSKEEDRSG